MEASVGSGDEFCVSFYNVLSAKQLQQGAVTSCNINDIFVDDNSIIMSM